MESDILTLQLRSLVQDCLSKHMYGSAVFFANKLMTLGSDPADVLLLAEAYYASAQYHRALLLLRQTGIIEHSEALYLAARCYAECKEWEECLTLLGDGDEDETSLIEQSASIHDPACNISLYAGVCLLRARAFEALDSRARAIQWYKAALQADPFCQEAFSALVEHHMLSNEEELALVDGLQVAPEHGWLKLLYRCKCKKYDQQDIMEQQLLQLEEGPEPAEQQQELEQQQEAPDTAGTPGPSSQQAMHMDITPGQSQQGMAGTPMGTPDWLQRPAATGDDDEEDRQASTSGLWGLADNVDVMACRADWLYHRGAFDACYQLTLRIMQSDPYALECLPSHVASALQLGKKNELFLRGHKLVQEYPGRAQAWYTVGCYYMCAQQYDNARRYFGKATTLDPNFAPAWIGFGNAFAAQDESDQAMAAYRTAARLFPGLHQPYLGMGMEYQRMSNLHLAEHMFNQAYAVCPTDPLVSHELGVLAYKNGQHATAVKWFKDALQMLPEQQLTAAWEPTLANLAHALRKMQRYEEAAELYRRAISLQPSHGGNHSALGYTLQLQGKTQAAVECYHAALGLSPDDVFAAEMLSAALTDDDEHFHGNMAAGQGLGLGLT